MSARCQNPQRQRPLRAHLLHPTWERWQSVEPNPGDFGPGLLPPEIEVLLTAVAPTCGCGHSEDAKEAEAEWTMIRGGARAALRSIDPVYQWPDLSTLVDSVADVVIHTDQTPLSQTKTSWLYIMGNAAEEIADRITGRDPAGEIDFAWEATAGNMWSCADFGVKVVLLAHDLPILLASRETEQRLAEERKASRVERRRLRPDPHTTPIDPDAERQRAAGRKAVREQAEADQRQARTTEAGMRRQRLADAYGALRGTGDPVVREDALHELRRVAVEVGADKDAAWAKAELRNLRKRS